MAPWQSISNGKGRSLVFLHHLLTIARASISRFLADLHDLNRSQVLPMLEPHVEEGRVICLHQLKAPITVLLQPTVHVDQTVRQHSAFLMKPLIDIVFSTWQEGLDNHVSLHLTASPMAQAEPSTIFQYESFPGLRTTGQVERAIVGEKLHDGVQIMGIECVRDCLQGFYGDRLHGYFIFSKV